MERRVVISRSEMHDCSSGYWSLGDFGTTRSAPI